MRGWPSYVGSEIRAWMEDPVRILFTTWPAFGHLLPMLPLARAARAAGHDVVISSGSDLLPLIERHGFRAHRSGTTQA